MIVYGKLKDSRLDSMSLAQPTPPPTTTTSASSPIRYTKNYHDGSIIELPGPWEYVVSESEIRSASHIINTLSKYRKDAIKVEADKSSFSNLDRTFVALGGINEISRLALNDKNNTFLEFVGDSIHVKNSNTEFKGFQGAIRKDYGIVLKMPNMRFPGKFFFVCAGIGEWGTSGASWYLAAHWRDLQKKFANNGFGIVVEVDIGSDKSALMVYHCV